MPQTVEFLWTILTHSRTRPTGLLMELNKKSKNKTTVPCIKILACRLLYNMRRINTTLTHLRVIFPGCDKLFPLILFYFIFLRIYVFQELWIFRPCYACVNVMKKVQWWLVALGLLMRAWWPTKNIPYLNTRLWTERSVRFYVIFHRFSLLLICV